MSGLSASLTSLGGNLQIENNDSALFTDLTGLENIATVGGYININGNQNLSSVSGLDGLQSTAKYISMTYNPSLSTISLPSLTTLGMNPSGDMSISFTDNGSPAVTSISFPLLQTVDGNIWIRWWSGLSSISMPQLTGVGGYFNIEDCDNLTTVTCTNLATVGGDFRLLYNGGLADVSGFPALASVGGKLDISQSVFTNLDPWATTLESIGGLYLYNNANLENIDGLAYLGNSAPITIGGDVVVNYNHNILFTDLPNWSGIQEIQGSFTVYDCDSLNTLGNLTGLNTIGGDVLIANNSALDHLDNFGSPAFAEISGYLDIYSNSTLLSISGLNTLTTVGGNIYIRSNPALQQLTGLGNVATVGGGVCIGTDVTGGGYPNNSLTHAQLPLLTSIGTMLRLYGGLQVVDFTGLSTIPQHLQVAFTALSDLSGLATVTTIGGNLNITQNSALTSMLDLAGVTTIGSNLIVTNNTHALFDKLFGAAAALSTVGGFIDISSNTGLTSLAGLQNITNVPSYLNIASNNELVDLSALGNLQTVGGYLNFGGLTNASLTSLSAVASLRVVSSYFTIVNCDGLTEIGIPTDDGGDPAIKLSVSFVQIYNNDNLPRVSVIDPWVAAISVVNPGSNYITGNAP